MAIKWYTYCCILKLICIESGGNLREIHKQFSISMRSECILTLIIHIHVPLFWSNIRLRIKNDFIVCHQPSSSFPFSLFRETSFATSTCFGEILHSNSSIGSQKQACLSLIILLHSYLSPPIYSYRLLLLKLQYDRASPSPHESRGGFSGLRATIACKTAVCKDNF